MSTWSWWICGTRSWTGSRPKTGSHQIGITVNRNAVPFDPRPPMVSSGLRIGTPALATRGFGAAEFTEVADIIASALISPATENELSDETTAGLRGRVSALAARFPLYPHLGGNAAATGLEAELIGAAQ